YNPVPSTVLSNLGILFTGESVISMRKFASVLPQHEQNVLMWGIQPDPQSQIRISLGAGHLPQPPPPTVFEDQIEGVRFYWLGKQPNLDLLRTRYCVEFESGK